MPQIPTVTIEDPFKPGDFRIINESDFDPKKHTRWGEKSKASVADIKPAPFTPADDNAPLGYDSGDQFSDSDLRDAIKQATGKTPGPRTSREKLIEMFNGLNAAMAGA